MKTRNVASTERTFRAFLSYSHQDERIASKLHRELESYKVPKSLVGTGSPARLFPIFRDREELAASGNLSEKIEDALKRSEFLIVICTPNAAKSHWVDAEIRRFQALGKPASILAVIADGVPNALKAGFSEEQECFPKALRESGVEPIAGDIRPHADGWRNGKLKLIAGLLGIDLELVRQREQQADRQRKIQWSGIAATIAISIAAAGYFGLSATAKSKLAASERLRATEQADQAQRNLSTVLAGHASSLSAESRFPEAVRFAAAAYYLNPAPHQEASETLRQILAAKGDAKSIRLPFDPVLFALAGAGRFIVGISVDGRLVLLDANTLTLLAQGRNDTTIEIEDFDSSGNPPRFPTPVSPDGTTFASYETSAVVVQQVRGGKEVRRIPVNNLAAAAFSERNNLLMIDDCKIRKISMETAQNDATIELPPQEKKNCVEADLISRFPSDNFVIYKEDPFFVSGSEYFPSLGDFVDTSETDCTAVGDTVVDLTLQITAKQTGFCDAAGKLRPEWTSIPKADPSLGWTKFDGAALSPAELARIRGAYALDLAGTRKPHPSWWGPAFEGGRSTIDGFKAFTDGEVIKLPTASDQSILKPSAKFELREDRREPCDSFNYKSIPAEATPFVTEKFRFPANQQECLSQQSTFGVERFTASTSNALAVGEWNVVNSGGSSRARIGYLIKNSLDLWTLAFDKSYQEGRLLGLTSEKTTGASVWWLSNFIGVDTVVVAANGQSSRPLELRLPICGASQEKGRSLAYLSNIASIKQGEPGSLILGCTAHQEDESRTSHFYSLNLAYLMSDQYLQTSLHRISGSDLKLSKQEAQHPAFAKLSQEARAVLVSKGLLPKT